MFFKKLGKLQVKIFKTILNVLITICFEVCLFSTFSGFYSEGRQRFTNSHSRSLAGVLCHVSVGHHPTYPKLGVGVHPRQCGGGSYHMNLVTATPNPKNLDSITIFPEN